MNKMGIRYIEQSIKENNYLSAYFIEYLSAKMYFNLKMPIEELEYVIISINYNDNLTQDYKKLLITNLIEHNDRLKELEE